MKTFDGRITKDQVVRIKKLMLKKRMFATEYQINATDADAIGIAVSRYFKRDGGLIIQALCIALEDANFHVEHAEIRERYPWAWEEAQVSS